MNFKSWISARWCVFKKWQQQQQQQNEKLNEETVFKLKVAFTVLRALNNFLLLHRKDPLHKKLSFPLRISSVNVDKTAGSR